MTERSGPLAAGDVAPDLDLASTTGWLRLSERVAEGPVVMLFTRAFT